MNHFALYLFDDTSKRFQFDSLSLTLDSDGTTVSVTRTDN